MEPEYTERQVTSGGVSQSAQFAISMADQTHIMTILRDTLYTDRVLAVLREYSANAWDAHRQSGKADLPIKVTIPTDMDPTLRIRDFGSGMSQEDVFRIYSQYGASTKRDDNIAVGMMGIGSKSGFAYSDTFTVVSWNGGMKRIYIALLNETDTGTINLLAEEPCGEETGIEIQIPVRHQDMWNSTRRPQTCSVTSSPCQTSISNCRQFRTRPSQNTGSLTDSVTMVAGWPSWVAFPTV